MCMHVCERLMLLMITDLSLFCFYKGQSPFDVADESVASLLEELSKRQANVRETNRQSHISLSKPKNHFRLTKV